MGERPFRRRFAIQGSENSGCLPAMSPEDDKHAKAGEPWQRRRAGLALGAALLAGGAAVVLLRSVGEPFSPEPQAVPQVWTGGAAAAGDLEEQGSIAARVEQTLRGEANDSTFEDRSLVWRFLRESFGAPILSPSVDWFAADEALTWLRGAVGAGLEIEAELMRLGGDRSLSESLRCFALQHLGMWAEEHPLRHGTVEELRVVTGEVLAAGVSGNALRILHRSSVLPAENQWLRTCVLGMLENPDCPSERRVAALQIAVELEALEVESVARKLVEPSRPVAERVSAFLALGHLGNRETLQWLGSQPRPLETLVLEARDRAFLNLEKRL